MPSWSSLSCYHRYIQAKICERRRSSTTVDASDIDFCHAVARPFLFVQPAFPCLWATSRVTRSMVLKQNLRLNTNPPRLPAPRISQTCSMSGRVIVLRHTFSSRFWGKCQKQLTRGLSSVCARLPGPCLHDLDGFDISLGGPRWA